MDSATAVGLNAFDFDLMEVDNVQDFDWLHPQDPQVQEPSQAPIGLATCEGSPEDDSFFDELLSIINNCPVQQDQPTVTDDCPTEEDADVQEILSELMRDDEPASGSLPSTATSQPRLPMIEPQQLPTSQRQQQQQQKPQLKRPQKRHFLEHPPSPTAESSGSFDSAGDASQPVTVGREAEIDEMVAYIKEVIERSCDCKTDDISSKLKVHEVILTILLNSSYGNRSKDLRRILTFCDENGRETTGECCHFKTLDTETMGLLWQKIKGNKKATYDTFARAMRVRREKSKGYFDYLDSGKRSKKRIYKFGQKSLADMDRLKRTLGLFSEPQGCYY